MGIFRRILLVPHNNVVNLNNVMIALDNRLGFENACHQVTNQESNTVEWPLVYDSQSLAFFD